MLLAYIRLSEWCIVMSSLLALSSQGEEKDPTTEMTPGSVSKITKQYPRTGPVTVPGSRL